MVGWLKPCWRDVVLDVGGQPMMVVEIICLQQDLRSEGAFHDELGQQEGSLGMPIQVDQYWLEEDGSNIARGVRGKIFGNITIDKNRQKRDQKKNIV